jgi:hypothetical protein
MPHPPREVPVLGVCFALLSTPAVAQSTDDDKSDDIDLDDEDDDDIDESDDQPAPAPAPPPPPPEPDGDEGTEPEEGDIDFKDTEDEEDLLGEEEEVPVSDDTDADFRAAQTRLSKLPPDEEIEGWEQYLAKYPNSAFRSRIESRTNELMDQLYGGNRVTAAQAEDALQAEVLLALPLQLENINPRTHLQLAFEWGLPSYANFVGDYEHQIQREFSVHAAFRRRYQGWNLEVGPKWAIVKSTRTQTVVTLFGDIHLNTDPVYPGFRPQIAVGKKFGKLDAQIQGGTDLELRSYNGTDGEKQSELQVRLVGGANVYYAASDRVGVFGETYLNMKFVGADNAFDQSLFRFNVASFGLKFYPASAADQGVNKDVEVNIGATFPFMQQYWQFHFGSVMAQFNYFL